MDYQPLAGNEGDCIDLSAANPGIVAEVVNRGYTALVFSNQVNLHACRATGCASAPEVEVAFWERQERYDLDTHQRCWTFCRECARRLEGICSNGAHPLIGKGPAP